MLNAIKIIELSNAIEYEGEKLEKINCIMLCFC